MPSLKVLKDWFKNWRKYISLPVFPPKSHFRSWLVRFRNNPSLPVSLRCVWLVVEVEVLKFRSWVETGCAEMGSCSRAYPDGDPRSGRARRGSETWRDVIIFFSLPSWVRNTLLEFRVFDPDTLIWYVRLGQVWWDVVRWGEVRWGEARRGEARWGEARCEARRGKVKWGKARRGEMRQG